MAGLLMTAERRLAWGLDREVPADAKAAWGARAIVEKSGTFSLLWDRQSAFGSEEDRQKLAHLLDHGLRASAEAKFKQLRKAGSLRDARPETCVLAETDEVILVGDTNGSYGYLYLAAWLR